MNTSSPIWLSRSLSRLRAFRGESSGQIVVVFALTLTTLVAAAGGSIDLARAYLARQQLFEVATLGCQYASRPSIVQMATSAYQGTNGAAAYMTAVTDYITASLATQRIGLPQTNGTPFTFTKDGPADVSLAATVPTAFLTIARITEIPISATAHCYDNPASVPRTESQGLPSEGFERRGSTTFDKGTFRFYPTGGSSIATPTTSVPGTPSYTGEGGTAWYGTGYCLETDDEGTINADAPERTRSAELDCDDGSGRAGNSAISTKTYLAVGNYELRYWYRSRIPYPNYDPVYICGSTAADVAWANDRHTPSAPVTNALRTNQVNVYLDRDSTGAPPQHATIDGTQQLAGSNLIDVCVQSIEWIERSVRIYVGTPGSYWVSFAADGQNDSFGGQLDNIRLCANTCSGALLDNFPCAWRPSGWVAEANRPRTEQGCTKTTLLFRDTFESPTYPEDSPKHGISKTGNLNLSLGSSGTASSGWPGQSASGWATAPYNQVNYGVKGAHQGAQHILLDGWDPANGGRAKNRLTSRRFLLDPGYYRVEYHYISIVDFSVAGIYGTECLAAPGSGQVFPAATPLTGRIRDYKTIATTRSTNLVGAFLSHEELVSTPIGGDAWSSATRYRNPDGTSSASAASPPDRVDWQNYDAAAVNPVLDVCRYADSYRWIPRSVAIRIAKPGYYWLSFSATGGTGDGDGGGIDDLKLMALGSLYMTPPSPLVAIPVPGPQPGARIDFVGFYIIANPLKPTAPPQ